MERFEFKQSDRSNPRVHAIILELIGYWICLSKFGRYDQTKGVMVIGEMDVPILEEMENQILKYFTPEYSHEVLKSIIEVQY